MTKPLISVIIPVYNIKAYVAESIDSVIAQDIGFTDNIEVLLVDDGSTDGSSEVCKGYAERYHNNIQYIYQENSGVSAARNNGLELAQGEYIHFLDGDDLLSKNFYTKSIEFLKEHRRSVDFVASRVMFFDNIIDSHPLNYKFGSTRVIDVDKEPDAPILHAVSVVYKRDSLKDVRFDERVAITEDAKFLSDVIIKKRRYGVLKDSVYYYRKRGDGGSAISGKEKNRSFYDATPKYAYEHMLDTWVESGNSKHIEYTLLYDLSYRLDQKTQKVLNQKELKQYKDFIFGLIKRLDDEVIVKHRSLTIYKKLYALRKKYEDSFSEHLSYSNGVTYFDRYVLQDNRTAIAHLDFLTKKSESIYRLEGYINGRTGNTGVRHAVDVSGRLYDLSFGPRVQRQKAFLGDVYTEDDSFSIDIEVKPNDTIQIVTIVDSERFAIHIKTGPFTKLGALRYSYRRDGDLLIKRTSRHIKAYTYSKPKHVLLEARYWWQIAVNWRLRIARDRLNKLRSRNLKQLGIKSKVFEILKPFLIIAEAVVMIPRALVLRAAYYIKMGNKQRPIWIISDRGMAAGDNGEALFRYVASLKDCPADVYYSISRKSKDFKRMQSIGNVLDQDSLKYKLTFLLSDKIISSQADVETTNPFIRQGDHYVNLFNFDFVFLQHGIIRHDLSGWLNRFNKNISIFVTSAEKEYDSIFANPYYYEKENVLLSGLPRYDYLNDNPQKKLILAPTYRKNLARQKTNKNGSRRYDTTFKRSAYRKFYNDFMNDDRILSALRETSMTGQFYLHPAFAAQRQDFDENDEFKVMEFPYDYRTAFSEGEMLVSDHSSVVFDFAYLKKPVAYAHFDVDTFFDNHTYDKSDFFSDEDDGFGGVYYDYESLVEGVVKTIRSGCRMSEKYKARVDKFFYKVDKHNSRRVYDAIIASR